MSIRNMLLIINDLSRKEVTFTILGPILLDVKVDYG